MTASPFEHLNPLARDTDPLVSHKALDGGCERRELDRDLVRSCYRKAGAKGLTADEVDQITGKNLWRRVSDLFTAGELVDSGNTRKTRNGKSARVLVLREVSR
jgi:hypothetical protein